MQAYRQFKLGVGGSEKKPPGITVLPYWADCAIACLVALHRVRQVKCFSPLRAPLQGDGPSAWVRTCLGCVVHSPRHPRHATGSGRASSSSPGAGEEMKKGGGGRERRRRRRWSEKGGVIYHCLLSAGLPSSLQASAKWNRKDKAGARKKK